MNTLECLLKIWDTDHNSTNATRYERWQNKLYCCLQNGLGVLDEDISYKNTYKHKVLNDDYYKILKEDIDNVISYSVTFKQVVFKPIPQRTIFEEYFRTNKHHKGIYSLYLYYCYLLKVFPQKHPKQYLPYSIRQDIKKLNEYSEQVRFMATNKIEIKENLDNFAKTNYEEYKNLMGKRENLWKRYRRAKTKEDKSEILAEINNIQPVIKELRKYDKYCKDIFERSETMQNNLNNFDKNMQKEKDNVRSL